jgi:hypothetical protein
VRPANMSVTRIIGAPYIVSDDAVRNQFFVRVVNKHDVGERFFVELADAPVPISVTGFTETLEVAPLGEVVLPLVLQVSREDYIGKFMLRILLHDEADEYTLEREVEFVGPDPRLLREDNS